ncbi:MAG: DUF4058 family protein [Planctomycetota bacterium]|nr:DUF4058 family protein [Planctomycetota bacterium]
MFNCRSMPSPFPGMDPYLEDPAGWPNFHSDLIAEIKTELNRQLRPKYYARSEERVYVSDQDDPGRRVIIPDVRVVSHENWPLEPWTPAYADWAHRLLQDRRGN